jgi:ankyrin repeat protein
VTALCDAIQERRWPEALRIVETGVVVTNTDQRGRSALAALTHRWFGPPEDAELRLKLLREFLNRGADPFAVGFSGFDSPGNVAIVEVALRKVDPSLGDLLLTNCPSPARRTPRGDTALHLAAQSARTNVIASLLATGFSINQTNNDGVTPLQLIVASALMGTFVCTNERPPFFLRRTQKGPVGPTRADVAEFLLSRGATLDACSAAGMGMTNQLTALLRTNTAPVDMRDGLGRTPLHYAAKAGQSNTAALLIRAGADCPARTKTGASPLHFACAHENEEIVRMLLKASVPVDQPDADGNTPLHLSARWGATSCPALLVSAHAPLNVTNHAGKTPLRIAVERGNFSVVELLLKSGAHIEVGLGDGTLLHVAAAQGAPDPRTGTDSFAAEMSAQSIPVLLRHGLAVDAPDGEGRTPLHRAVTSLNWKAMNLLLTNGANINAADIRGNTALHLIATQMWCDIWLAIPLPLDPAEKERRSRLDGQWPEPHVSTNISVTSWLLDHGANPNLTNRDGLTPLELVCDHHWGYWYKKSATNRVTLLIRAGAKVSKPGYEDLEACLGKIK